MPTRGTCSAETLQARLRGFDPFLDDTARALRVDDPAEVRELLDLAVRGRQVVFTFPILPEVFQGSLMLRPGSGPDAAPLLLVDLTAAGLDTTRWARNVPVNLGFFDGREYLACRTQHAGGIGRVMALTCPRTLLRFCPPGRERLPVPFNTALLARFSLAGEGARVCWVREVGPGSVQGTVEAGPLHRPGLGMEVELTLPDGNRVTAAGRLVRMWQRRDGSRDVIVDLDGLPAETAARLAACGRRPDATTSSGAPT